MTRRDFVSASLLAGAALAASPRRLLGSSPFEDPTFPRIDYHVHLSPGLSVEQAVELARSRGARFGIVDHPGRNVGGFRQIETDEQLRAYIGALRAHPVYVGLQPVFPEWSKPFAPDTLAQLDYILMDALTMPDGAGGWMYLWAPDVFIDDEDAFMERYVAYIHQLLTTERIDIFAWPTYLPTALARNYDRLWTRVRREGLVERLRQKRIAVEINEVAHVPDASFIALAREAGLKFTFGTDARNGNAGRFSYCRRMAETCGLTAADMWTIERKS